MTYVADVFFYEQVGFDKAVVATALILHMTSDGIAEWNSDTRWLKVILIDTEGHRHDVGNENAAISCRSNPVTVNVNHDLTQPFFKTREAVIEFDSPHIAISAVRMRSSDTLDPVTLESCSPHALYNPRTQKCVEYTCELPRCPLLSVDHANISCTGPTEGDTCHVKCRKVRFHSVLSPSAN